MWNFINHEQIYLLSDYCPRIQSGAKTWYGNTATLASRHPSAAGGRWLTGSGQLRCSSFISHCRMSLYRAIPVLFAGYYKDEHASAVSGIRA